MNKTSTTSFICSLNGDIQKLIYLDLLNLKQTTMENLDIDEAMSGRLLDLENYLDINKYI